MTGQLTDDQIDNLANWRSIIAWGTFEELKDEEAEAGMQLIKSRLMPLQASVFSLYLWDVQTKDLSTKHSIREAVFRIRLTERTGRFEKSE